MVPIHTEPPLVEATAPRAEQAAGFSGAVMTLLAGLACVLAALTVGRGFLALPHGAGLTDESGVLAGLAMDARHGVFYRPLMGELGYGGTRYGPLYVTLHAAMIIVLGTPLWSGYAVSMCALAGLVFVQFRLLREVGLASSVAMAGAILFIATASGQFAVTTIRADLLATALSFAGVLLVTRASSSPGDRPSRYSIAAVAFALAGLAKFTTIFGIAAAVVWLILNRRWKSAFTVAGMTLVFWLVGVGCFDWASHGRLLENWHACANGGRPPRSIPKWLAVLKEAWYTGDRCGLLAVIAALVAWVASPNRIKFSLLGLLLLCSALLTPLMFFSPGIATNSLLDADTAAVLFLASLLTTPITPPARRWIPAVALIVITAVGLFDTSRVLRKATYDRLGFFRAELSRAGYTGGPILSDHSLVPVAAGQSPFLLDDFNLPAIRNSLPQVQQDLYDRIDRGYFQAIVLRYDPARNERRWVFGDEFAAKLLSRYQLVEKTSGWDQLWVYRLKP